MKREPIGDPRSSELLRTVEPNRSFSDDRRRVQRNQRRAEEGMSVDEVKAPAPRSLAPARGGCSGSPNPIPSHEQLGAPNIATEWLQQTVLEWAIAECDKFLHLQR